METQNNPGSNSSGNKQAKFLSRATIFSLVGLMLVFGTVSSNLLPSAHAAASTLNVNGFSLDGKPLSMWIEVRQSNGATSAIGFTPLSFAGETGSTYTVTAHNYLGGNISFERWDNGSVERTRQVTLDRDVSLTAYYKTPPTESLYTLTVNAYDQNDTARSMYTTIREDGTVVKTGFTMLAHEAKSGTQLSVTVSDYGTLTFDRWEDGSTARTRTVSILSDTAITAYYHNSAAQTSEPANNSPPAPTNFTLNVSSADMAGNPKTGMYTVIREGSTVVKTGFTSLSHTASAGTTYSVTVSDYGSSVFDHWENGSTARARTVTLNADITIIAHYRVPVLEVSPSSGPSSTSISVTGTYFSPSSSVVVSYNGKSVASANTNSAGSFATSFIAPTSGIGSHTVTAEDSKGWKSSANFEDTTVHVSHPLAEIIPKTGVLVSLYVYPGSTGSVHWQKVIDEKNKHPSVPIVVIFNPSSGPGSSRDSNIANWVGKLQSADIVAIGYIPDGYADTKKPGTRSMSYMKDAINKYSNWYKADGVYFDEFTNKAGYESRYSELSAHAKSLGMKMTAGNAGTDVPPSYIGTVDMIKISEGRGYISSSDPTIVGSSWVTGGYSGWHKDHDKRNFTFVRYDVNWLDKNFVLDTSKSVGLMYITDGNDSNARWMHVPPYLGELVATLDR